MKKQKSNIEYVSDIFYIGFDDITYFASLEQIAQHCLILETLKIRYRLNKIIEYRVKILLKENRKNLIKYYKNKSKTKEEIQLLGITEENYWLS